MFTWNSRRKHHGMSKPFTWRSIFTRLFGRFKVNLDDPWFGVWDLGEQHWQQHHVRMEHAGTTIEMNWVSHDADIRNQNKKNCAQIYSVFMHFLQLSAKSLGPSLRKSPIPWHESDWLWGSNKFMGFHWFHFKWQHMHSTCNTLHLTRFDSISKNVLNTFPPVLCETSSQHHSKTSDSFGFGLVQRHSIHGNNMIYINNIQQPCNPTFVRKIYIRPLPSLSFGRQNHPRSHGAHWWFWIFSSWIWVRAKFGEAEFLAVWKCNERRGRGLTRPSNALRAVWAYGKPLPSLPRQKTEVTLEVMLHNVASSHELEGYRDVDVFIFPCENMQ